MFLEKDVLEICSKFTGKHQCRSAISIKLQSNFVEITLRHGCSPLNLHHIFRTPFPKNTSGPLLEEKINAQTGKPMAKKVIIKFLFLILTLNHFISRASIISKSKVAQWEPSVHYHMRISIWESLNRHIFIGTSERKQ